MPDSSDVVIVAAKRTAIGTFNGSFSTTPAHKLGEAVIRDVLSSTGIDGGDVSEVILGQVLTAGQGQTLQGKLPSMRAFLKKFQPGPSTKYAAPAFALHALAHKRSKRAIAKL